MVKVLSLGPNGEFLEINVSTGGGGPAIEEIRYDLLSEVIVYRGDAETTGALESDPVWKIRKITYFPITNIIDTQYADGSTSFNKVWDNHLSYSYS